MVFKVQVGGVNLPVSDGDINAHIPLLEHTSEICSGLNMCRALRCNEQMVHALDSCRVVS